jgi:hypothetical protein
MTVISDLGIFGLAIAALTLGLFIGIVLTLGAVQLIGRIIWHIYIMSRSD